MKRTTLLLIVLAVLLAACGGDDAPSPTATLADSGSVKGTPDVTGEPGPTSTPGSGPTVAGEPVSLQAADGTVLKANLYSGQGARRKVVILAHGANEDQKSWQPFAQELASKGVAAFTLDFRGHGETSGTRDAAKMPEDLALAVRYLRSQDWPLIYIVGSDLGGTAAIKTAAGEELAGLATISSMASAGGLNAAQDVGKVVEPKLFLAGGNDINAGAALLALAQAATEPKQSKLIDGTAAHGIALLQVAAAKEALLMFLNP